MLQCIVEINTRFWPYGPRNYPTMWLRWDEEGMHRPYEGPDLIDMTTSGLDPIVVPEPLQAGVIVKVHACDNALTHMTMNGKLHPFNSSAVSIGQTDPSTRREFDIRKWLDDLPQGADL